MSDLPEPVREILRGEERRRVSGRRRRTTQRWEQTSANVHTDGRYRVVRQAPGDLTQAGIPVYLPWRLTDRGTYVDNFLSAAHAITHAQSKEAP